MEFVLFPFLRTLILVPVTLLPIINPLGTAPVFAATVGRDRDLAQRLAYQVAVNSWFIIVGSMLIGTYVLALFGVSLPVVRLGGGLLVAAAGWRMLHRNDDDDVHVAAAESTTAMSDREVVRRSLFPITFPLTTGPGTIAASIALGANNPSMTTQYFAGAAGAAVGAALVSLVLYFLFKNSRTVLDRLGEIGTMVMIRMLAFILLCVGIQIMWNGWSELNQVAP